MRRSRFRSINSRIRRSSFRYGSGVSFNRYGRYGRSVPLKGPAAVLVLVFIILFLVSFILNFVFAFFLPEFLFEVGIWLFFIPFFSMIGIFITTIVASIVGIAKGQTSGFNGTAFTGGPSLLDAARNLGLQVKMLPNQNPSTAQAVVESSNAIILVKILGPGQPFENGMVQNLSKGLVTYQAKEAWLIQNPPTFVENDLNFARFYNVKLLKLEEALQALQSLQPQPNTPQGQ